MADMTPATQGPSFASVVKQWQDFNDTGRKIIESINKNFAGIKISTTPFDKLASALAKIKTISDAVDFGKMALGIAKSTTAFVANTLATNLNTAAKNSNVLSSIKEIAENIELIVLYGQDKAAIIANTIAQKALDLAESMNPMGIVITLIVALVAAIVILWNKNAAFREFITGMFQALVALVQTVVASIRNFFAGLWNGIVAIFTPVGAWFAGVFNGAWNNIRNAFAATVGFFQGIWNGIVGVFSQVGGWFANVFNGAWNNIRNAFAGVGGLFQGIWGSIVGIFSSIGVAVGNAVGGAFRNVVNSILGFAQNIINGFLNDINYAVGILDNIPGVHIPRVPMLSLPRLAAGGITDGATVAMIGEAGREAVLPLQSNTGWMDTLAAKIASQVSQGSANSGSGSNGDMQLVVKIGDSTLISQVIKGITRQQRAAGASLITV